MLQRKADNQAGKVTAQISSGLLLLSLRRLYEITNTWKEKADWTLTVSSSDETKTIHAQKIHTRRTNNLIDVGACSRFSHDVSLHRNRQF